MKIRQISRKQASDNGYAYAVVAVLNELNYQFKNTLQ